MATKTQKYWNNLNPTQRRMLAHKCQVHQNTLGQAMRGTNRPGPKLAQSIAKYTDLTLHDLRPDLWKRGEK